jgi:hypothetical protein
MSRRQIFLRTIAATAALVTGMIAAPTAALAVFNDSEKASAEYSTATIPAPVSANVSMSCQFGLRATVTVNSYSAAANANYHDIKIFDRYGKLEFTGDLSKPSGRTYTSGFEIIGTWTYEIRGYYKVPGTSNIWTGKVLKGSLSC